MRQRGAANGNIERANDHLAFPINLAGWLRQSGRELERPVFPIEHIGMEPNPALTVGEEQP